MSAPTGWTTVAVGDVFHVQLGKMLSEKAKVGTSPFRYLGNRHVKWGVIDTADLPTMDYSEAEREKFSLKDGDLLVCEGGEVGRAAIWRGQARNCYYQKALHRLRPKTDTIIPEYMYRYLQVAAARNLFSGLTSQTSIAHLTKEKLETLELPLPPLPEQKRIAAILDKADEIRRKRARAIKLTEELLRSAFLEMFGDPVTNPKGWEVKKLGEVCRVIRGSSPRPKGDPRYYGGPVPRLLVADVTRDGWFVTPRKDSLTEAGAKLSRPVPTGTVVMAVSGNVGLMGRLQVDACIHDGFAALVDLDKKVLPNVLMLTLHFLQDTHASREAGAIFKNITTTDIREMLIPFPKLAAQKEFEEVFVRQLAALSVQKRRADEMENLASAITQRAFRGEL